MADYVGNVGNKHHYVAVEMGTWHLYATHIVVTEWETLHPSVRAKKIGRVKSYDDAVDRVVGIVHRERQLAQMRGQ